MPSPLSTTVPCAGSPRAAMDRLSPSMSLSSANRSDALIVRLASSIVVALSSSATGASFAGSTVRLTVAVAVAPLPSATV